MTLPLKQWGVPMAPATGQRWPVLNGNRTVSYTLATGTIVGNGATRFGAEREGGIRFHAGMDLVCSPGDKIVAMEPGKVIGMISGFVRLGAVVIAHPSVIGVYAEIALDSLSRAGLKAGDSVSAGQVIGFGALNYEGRSMLHTELWAPGHAPPMYTPWLKSAPPPAGLYDPSEYLIKLSTGVAPVSASSGGGGGSSGRALLGGLLFAWVAHRVAKEWWRS